MSKRKFAALVILGIIALLIPFEHKYDKLFRFFSLTLIPSGLEVSRGYDKLIYFYVSDILVVILSILGLICFRIPLRKWFGNPLWIVWVCAIFSILASPFSNYPIPYFRLVQLFTPFALFSLIAHIGETRKITRLILYCVAFAGLIETFIGISQYFHQSPLGLRLFGETQQAAIFYTESGARWLLDKFLGYTPKSSILMRASGTFPHANVFGGFMVFSIVASYYLSAKTRFWMCTLPFQFFALAVSYSRAALFGWCIATFIWIFFMKKRLYLALLMSATMILTATLLYEQWVYRGGVVNYNTLVQQSDKARIVQQSAALQIIKDHPFFGLGFTQFSQRSQPYFKDEVQSYVRETAPHNIFLFLACETGLISAAAFLIFISSCMWRFYHSPKNRETVLFFSLFSAFLFIGFCDFYPILFQQGRLMFFLIASLLAANSNSKVSMPQIFENSDLQPVSNK